jgi:DNA repair protein RadC
MVSVEYRLTIKEMPAELRPRERLAKEGPAGLSTAELLAIVLRTGFQAGTAIDLAAQLLSRFNGLKGLLEASVEELSTTKGIGPAKAAQIKAALEVGRRVAATAATDKPVIKCPGDVSGLMMEKMRHYDREHFVVLHLNTKNQVVAEDTVSIGSLNASLVHPRELFKNAIKKSAAALILVHNHPSGDPSPSREDIDVTRRLTEAGQLLGIEILDHVVIGDLKYVSLKEKGII